MRKGKNADDVKEIIVYEMIFRGRNVPPAGIECVPFDDGMWEEYAPVYNECFREMRTALEIEPYDFYSDISQTEQKKDCLFVLMNDGRLVGSVACIGSEVDDLIVRKDCQGRGYGRALLRFAMRKILDGGQSEVVLHAAQWNEKAIKLYLDEGFEITKTEKVR